MTNEELVRAALEKVGGKSNVLTATNCMTRLRVRVKDDAKIDDDGLKAIEGVMGIVHDRTGYVEIVVGPGKCRKCADICRDMGIPADAAASTANDWQTNKAAVKAGQKQSKVKELFKTFGDIFIPLIPGVVASGLCAGINSLIGQVVPNYADIPALALISTLLGLMNTCFLGYLTAWVGYRAAEKFGGTPILGGMLGMITGLEGINKISSILGLFNEAVPLDSILRAGRGGVLAVVLGAGDSFHLVPRALALCTTGLENYAVPLGLGKWITSVTMTVFYVLLYYVWRKRYQIEGQKNVTAAVYALSAVRVVLCMMPQNQWLTNHTPLAWGILRNVPFALLGLLIIVLFYRSAKQNNDKAFRWMWLTIVLSFGFYIPVVLWADVNPLIGMLMIPKTCAYVWTVLIGYNAMKAETGNQN
jgi:phosphotransferase system IIB component